MTPSGENATPLEIESMILDVQRAGVSRAVLEKMKFSDQEISEVSDQMAAALLTQGEKAATDIFAKAVGEKLGASLVTWFIEELKAGQIKLPDVPPESSG